MQAVIVAGGEGVRLRPFTYAIPKPLLPVGDKTVVECTLALLKDCGFTEVIVVVNYKPEQFLDFFEKWEKENANNFKITIFIEKQKLGTAGSLSLIKDQLKDTFCVINGDLLVRAPLLELMNFHIKSESDLTTSIKQYEYKVPYAVVDFDNDKHLTSLAEKPSYYHKINTGIYAMSHRALQYLPHDKYFDMPSLIEKLIRNDRRVKVFDIGAQWLDMGQILDYERAIEIIAEWDKI